MCQNHLFIITGEGSSAPLQWLCGSLSALLDRRLIRKLDAKALIKKKKEDWVGKVREAL